MDTRIKALVGVHFVAFVAAAIAAYGRSGPEPASIVLLAFISADAALLGVWASLAAARWQIRLCVVSGVLSLFWATFVAGQQHLKTEEFVFFAFVIGLPPSRAF